MNASSPHIFVHCSSSSSSSLSLSLPMRVSCCSFPANNNYNYNNYNNYNNNNHIIININKTNLPNNSNDMMTAVAARDMAIEFGKHKGKMLGTLSSEYLRWMSKNLNTGDFEKWGKLAEDVLEDEIYADRMEWEVAERLLSGVMGSGSGVGVAAELEETSKRFGWDYNDKVGWSKVDFKLLGTSMGGRLPRRMVKTREDSIDEESKLGGVVDKKQQVSKNVVNGVEREKRRERAEAKRREQQKKKMSMNEEHDDKVVVETMNNETKHEKTFPGRQSLINKLR